MQTNFLCFSFDLFFFDCKKKSECKCVTKFGPKYDIKFVFKMSDFPKSHNCISNLYDNPGNISFQSFRCC